MCVSQQKKKLVKNAFYFPLSKVFQKQQQKMSISHDEWGEKQDKQKKETKWKTFIDILMRKRRHKKPTHICRDNINVTINMIGTTHNNHILFAVSHSE